MLNYAYSILELQFALPTSFAALPCVSRRTPHFPIVRTSWWTLRVRATPQQMVLQSPDLSDETFEYVRKPNEHDLILGVVDTPQVAALQQQLYELLERADGAAAVHRGVQSGVAALMSTHHRLLAHDQVLVTTHECTLEPVLRERVNVCVCDVFLCNPAPRVDQAYKRLPKQ